MVEGVTTNVGAAAVGPATGLVAGDGTDVVVVDGVVVDGVVVDGVVVDVVVVDVMVVEGVVAGVLGAPSLPSPEDAALVAAPRGRANATSATNAAARLPILCPLELPLRIRCAFVIVPAPRALCG